MITNIKINKYKNLDKVTLRFAPLNLLVGDNGIGKTAVLETVAIALDATNRDYSHLSKGSKENSDIIATLVNRDGEDIEITVNAKRPVRIAQSGNVTQGTEKAEWHFVPLFADTPPVAFCGEPAPDLLIKDTGTDMLAQCNHWLNRIAGIEIYLENYWDWGYSMRRIDEFHREAAETSSSLCEAGFGLRHVAEIIRTGLNSRPGDIIILENPEIGLSESAQSKLFGFLLHLATHDRQVFVETHSCHIFNALRICADTKKRMEKSGYSVNFLTRDRETGSVICNPVTITEHGDLRGETSLCGFFDQYSEDLNVMLGLYDPDWPAN